MIIIQKESKKSKIISFLIEFYRILNEKLRDNKIVKGVLLDTKN